LIHFYKRIASFTRLPMMPGDATDYS